MEIKDCNNCGNAKTGQGHCRECRYCCPSEWTPKQKPYQPVKAAANLKIGHVRYDSFTHPKQSGAVFLTLMDNDWAPVRCNFAILKKDEMLKFADELSLLATAIRNDTLEKERCSVPQS